MTKKIKKESPNVGLEPTTLRLRASCSTDWASSAVYLMLPVWHLVHNKCSVRSWKRWSCKKICRIILEQVNKYWYSLILIRFFGFWFSLDTFFQFYIIYVLFFHIIELYLSWFLDQDLKTSILNLKTHNGNKSSKSQQPNLKHLQNCDSLRLFNRILP